MVFLTIVRPQIQKFYKNKTILVTGGTGFVGKLLVEKLLRSCPEVERIIVPMRSKKHISVEQRIAQYFDDKMFDILKDKTPNIYDKVLFVNTNLEQKGCGLHHDDYNMVKNSTNIVFHCAASVNFAAKLIEAVNNNIRITKNVTDFAKEMTNLQAFVFVSTAWSNSLKNVIEEKVCGLSYKPEAYLNLVDNFDEKFIENITPFVQNKWGNLYLMSKNVSETVVEREKENFPVAIFRPAGVLSTYKEPTPGIMPMQGLTMIGTGLASGLMKVILTNGHYIAHIVPADYVVNCMITIPWYMVTNKRQKVLDVYNYSPMKNAITRKTFYDSFVHTKYSLENVIWKPGYIETNSEWWYKKFDFMCHTIPAFINDNILSKFTKRPTISRIVTRNRKLLQVGSFFLLPNFKFENKNVPDLWKSLNSEDQKLFIFDLESLDWKDVMDVFTKSVKKLVKENINNEKTV